MRRGLSIGVLAMAAFSCRPSVPPAPPPVSPVAMAPNPVPDAPSAAPIALPDPADEHQATVEDETDDEDAPAEPAPSRGEGSNAKPPALALDDAAFARALREEPTSLGCMSVGRTNAGLLVNGVQLPEGADWRRIDPDREWGTEETIEAIRAAIGRVVATFPGTAPLPIGHVGARHGGPLSPHKSHQSGRDADIGYYYTTKSPWFARATADNLDRPRTWALVKAFAEGDVEMILIDVSVQKLLRDYALSHGEDRDLVDRLIQVGSKNAWTVVRHVPGHATHLHVRFSSPAATSVGARAEPFYRADLAKAIAARAPSRPDHHATRSKEAPAAADKTAPAYFEHRLQNGDTLYRLAHRYGTTVEAIQRLNGLRGVALKQKSILRIPKG
jgi:murein endopeptidase